MKLNEFLENLNEKEDPEIGWKGMPDGWDKDSLKKYSESLTGHTPGEEEFFEACVREVEGHVDDPNAFCASIKDEYLGREDWREGRGGD
jgi:hypothetical protein